MSQDSYTPLFTPKTQVQIDAGITSEDIDNLHLVELIRTAEDWAIGKLEMLELWSAVESQINAGNVPRQLRNASKLYASALVIQRIYASGGSRSQTNFPESFNQRSVGSLSVGQPDWRSVYNNKMAEAKQALEDYIKFLVGEEESNENNLVGQVSNRDFESAWDNSFMGHGVGDFDLF